MRSVVLALAVLVVVSGCGWISGVIESPAVNAIVKDAEAFGTAVMKCSTLKDDCRWKDVHDSALRLQDAYVVLAGVRTIEEEYGGDCATALSLFFMDDDISTVQIMYDSPFIALLEQIGPLRRIDALTIGPRVIHVRKGATLPLAHEVAHIVQWASAQETFLIQYLPVVLLAGGEGYTASVFEQDAMLASDEFTKGYGAVCTLEAL